MGYQDKALICLECRQVFIFPAREQAFYMEQGCAPPSAAQTAELSAASVGNKGSLADSS